MAYDVFISYRRETGADDARLLQQALKARGFDVFFDYDSLRDGKFNQKIFEAIDEAPVFVLLLTARSLDRCAQEGDWVRMEIEHALAKGRHIVPVAPSSQVWSFPVSLPESLRDIPFEQVSELNKTSLFEASIDDIVDNRFPEGLKGKRRKVGGIVSTVARASEVFIGRDDELSRLHELLAAGKFPVVTGPGGTGKSELARQYAARYRTEYPGGSFQVDMETVRDWDGVFESLLSGGTDSGTDLSDLLDMGKSQGKEQLGNVHERDRGQDEVRLALARRAEREGPLLLVFDNVESTRAFLREPILEKLKLHRDIRLVATARTADSLFRPGDRAVEFPLEDLSPEAALELLLKDHPASAEDEKVAAMRIAERLGYRVLYLKAIPGLMDDIYSSCAGSYVALDASLKEKLQETLEEGMELEDGSDRRTPSALWTLTQQALLSRPGGEAWVDIARIVSFFSPEGVLDNVLRPLWQDMANSTERTGLAFGQAMSVLEKHGVLSNQGKGKKRAGPLWAKRQGVLFQMHRLTRWAIQEDTRQTKPNFEAAMGEALARQDADPRVWAALASSTAIVRHVSDRKRRMTFYIGNTPIRLGMYFLLENPDTHGFCDWTELSSGDWVELLCRWPCLEDKCPWDNLSDWNWSQLLAEQPRFADKCPWEKLSGGFWSFLLGKHPQFADRCPWNKLDGWAWCALLEAQPQFADKCPWEKLELDGWNWCQLLRRQPQFADKCEWKRLDVWEWLWLLEDQPQLSDACPWGKLDGWNWIELLRKHPQFADRCPWKKLEGSDWSRLLRDQPQFAEKCRWEKLSGGSWSWLLGKQPQFADKCPWEKLTARNWNLLLREQPQFAGKCTCWDGMSDIDISLLLKEHPDLRENISKERIDKIMGKMGPRMA